MITIDIDRDGLQPNACGDEGDGFLSKFISPQYINKEGPFHPILCLRHIKFERKETLPSLLLMEWMSYEIMAKLSVICLLCTKAL